MEAISTDRQAIHSNRASIHTVIQANYSDVEAIHTARESMSSKPYSRRTRQQLAQNLPKLRDAADAHVVCEATRGYERDLVAALHKAKIPISVVNPVQVRAAAHAKGQRAKSDRIDAAMLTEHGQR